MVFDVKYDLRHKARLVSVGNWTVNDKEDIYSGVFSIDTVRIDIYSGVVSMDTVRIVFFLGELYGLSVVHVTSEMPSYTEKQRRRSI
jgi:hypothetical protein